MRRVGGFNGTRWDAVVQKNTEDVEEAPPFTVSVPEPELALPEFCELMW